MSKWNKIVLRMTGALVALGAIVVFVGVLLFLPVQAQQANPRELILLSAADIDVTAFNYCIAAETDDVVCTTGTAAVDGWITVPSEQNKSIQVQVDTLVATSAEFIIQGRNRGGSGLAAQIWPASGNRSYTSSEDPISFIQEIPDSVHQIRVGFKVTGSTAGTESVTIVFNSFAPDRR